MFCAAIVAGYFCVVLAQAGEAGGGRSLCWELALYATVLVLPYVWRITTDHLHGVYPKGWPVVHFLLAFLVLGISQSKPAWGLAAILDIAPLRLLGTASYSLYLWHGFVLGTIWGHWSGISDGVLGTNIAKTVCAFPATIVVTWLSYQLLELRFGRLMAQLWDRANEQALAHRHKGA